MSQYVLWMDGWMDGWMGQPTQALACTTIPARAAPLPYRGRQGAEHTMEHHLAIQGGAHPMDHDVPAHNLIKAMDRGASSMGCTVDSQGNR